MNRKQNHEKKRLLRGPVLVRQSDKPVRSCGSVAGAANSVGVCDRV